LAYNAPKSFGGRAPLGQAEGSHSAPTDPLAGFRGRKGKEKKEKGGKGGGLASRKRQDYWY